jgi:hypothetical protein
MEWKLVSCQMDTPQQKNGELCLSVVLGWVQLSTFISHFLANSKMLSSLLDLPFDFSFLYRLWLWYFLMHVLRLHIEWLFAHF